jgi:beta-N-acetylhexosaminidase
LIQGLQSSGVAATAKHFPGHGDVSSDSHHGAPVVAHDAKRIARVELAPFRAAIKAGVRLIMTAHIVMPALNGGTDQPATVSANILRGILRKKLAFSGLIVGDAMDMHAMEQGPGYVAEAMAAVGAGLDLVLLNHDLSRIEPVFANIVHAARRGLLSLEEIQASAQRILALKTWLKRTKQPPLSVVGCREHLALAREVAEKSVTLVRDNAQRLPLRLASNAKIAVVVPRPEDLTPADTSSYVTPALAAAVRRYHQRVDEFFIGMSPSLSEVGALREKLKDHDLVILGTINATAHRGQADLVKAMIKQGTPLIAVALRMPYDLAVYPAVPTYACTYSILPPAMDALAAALWGKTSFGGQLPVSISEKSASA